MFALSSGKERARLSFVFISILLILSGCQNASQAYAQDESTIEEQSTPEKDVENLGCVEATPKQLALVISGNDKRREFLDLCSAQTNQSRWCDQLVRPNPESIVKFRCTYGSSQAHLLIHPNEETWMHAINAVKLIQGLEEKNIAVCEIYNWWRPEPYNKNVGGAAGRHPFGTSVDVRLCSNQAATQAFNELCEQRKLGKIRAIGYYGGSALHFGVGDKAGNTWGKSCN